MHTHCHQYTVYEGNAVKEEQNENAHKQSHKLSEWMLGV